MVLTTNHLRDMGFEVDSIYEEDIPTRVSKRMRRFTGPWEAAVAARRHIADNGHYDLIEVHEPLAAGFGLHLKKPQHQHKLIAFSYGIEDRGRRIMLDYGALHGIKTKLKSRLLAMLQSKISYAGLPWCDHIVTSNSEDAQYLVGRGTFRPDQITVHHSGVDPNLLVRGQSVTGPRGDVLFMGLWIERKGTLDMVPAIVDFLRANPHRRFTAAGCMIPAEEVIRPFPEDVRSRITVRSKIESDDELCRLYETHGTLVLPSFHEGQPLVLIEAAAFGMAILTTATCGMLDFVEHEKNGMLIPVGSTPAILAGLNRYEKSPETAWAFGQEARRKALTHTWRLSAENLARSYRRLLD
jgi:glycosyltransferase involved in cell wall biosynthesis